MRFLLSISLLGLMSILPATGTAQDIKPPVTMDKVQVPDGSPDELLQLMQGAAQEAQQSGLPFPDNFKLFAFTVIKAGDKVVAHKEATDEQKQNAEFAQLSVMWQGMQYAPKTFAPLSKERAEAFLKAKPKSDVAGEYKALLFQAKYADAEKIPAEAREEVMGLLKDNPDSRLTMSLVMSFVQQLEEKAQPDEAIQFIEQVLEISDSDQLAQALEGKLANLKLIGSEMELSGPTLEGKEFNLEQFKGKVVLVDFWATWCGPCIAELPNVKAAYEKYHEKGFEIVGVSLDDSKEDLEAFVKKNEMPWVQVIFNEESKRGWDNPIARRYGISGIPAMYLIGRDGKVITDQVRGEGVLEAKVEEALKKSPKS